MIDLKGRILAGKILVKQEDAMEKTSGGIIIPDNAKAKPERGTVVTTGKPTPTREMEVKVGEVVLYNKNSVTNISIEGEEYVLMNQTEVLYIL